MSLVDKILPVYRDEEAEVLDLIERHYATLEQTIHTGDQTPNDDALESVLPFIRVGRVGGAPRRGSEHTDRPVVDVDVFSMTRAEAKRIALEIQQLLMSAPRPIDACNVLMGPQRVPWVEGSPIRRMYASYHLALRR